MAISEKFRGLMEGVFPYGAYIIGEAI